MFKSLYDRILSVKFLNTVLIGCAVMGEACSLSHPITDMTTKEKAWEEFSHPVDSTRTKVWWFHGETETTREGITADLEAYKRAGIGGVVYYDPGSWKGGECVACIISGMVGYVALCSI